MVDVEARSGSAVMEGPGDRPLLVLDRQGEGRVAMLGSDHAWLWSRGFEGGGPQLELLRRLAHWLMQEPELEEEVLRGTGEEGGVSILRRTLAESVPPVIATSPSGATSEVALVEVAPGRWEGRIEEAENGVWRLENGEEAGGGGGRPLGAEGVREPGLDRRGAGAAGRRPPAAACSGSRTACPTCAWCARTGWPRAAAGSGSPTATPTSCATSARSSSPPAG